MTRRLLLAAAGWAVFGGTGCVTCRHDAAQIASCPVEPCPTDCVHRGRVHLIVVNGCDLLDFSGLAKLQAAVNVAGYPKVHVGQTYHAGALKAEARRAHCNDPDARFVVAGFDLGAGEAEALASYLSGLGAAVDAVVLLDPLYLSTPTDPLAGLVVIRSDGWTAGRPETSTVPGIGHLGLPSHPHVVGTLTDLLRESLSRVSVEETPTPTLLLVDDPAPLPVLPVGKPTSPGTPATPIPPAPKTVPGVLTAAGR